METADLFSNYRSRSDDELIQLAEDMDDLGPEARTVLAAELSKRGIGSGEISRYRANKEQIQKEERQQKLNSMFPSLRGIRARLADWRTFRQNTGQWPRLSIIFYVAHAAVAIAVLLAGVWYGVEYVGSKYIALALLMPIIIVDAVLSDWAERTIRLRELSQFRSMRQP